MFYELLQLSIRWAGIVRPPYLSLLVSCCAGTVGMDCSGIGQFALGNVRDPRQLCSVDGYYAKRITVLWAARKLYRAAVVVDDGILRDLHFVSCRRVLQ